MIILFGQSLDVNSSYRPTAHTLKSTSPVSYEETPTSHYSPFLPWYTHKPSFTMSVSRLVPTVQVPTSDHDPILHSDLFHDYTVPSLYVKQGTPHPSTTSNTVHGPP